MLVTNIPSKQIPRDIKCAKPCILVNLAKDNYPFKNDSERGRDMRSGAGKNDFHIWVLCLLLTKKEEAQLKWKKNTNLISALGLRRGTRV